MKASVADAAGTAPDTHAPIHICRSRGRESTTARSTVGSQFAADAVSDGRIAICYCLLRFANRASSQPSLGESEVYVCPRTWPPKPLAARRTRAGIGTIAGGPACLGFECCGRNADRGDDGASELRIAVCYGLRGSANRERGSCLTPPDPTWCQSSSSLRSSCAAVFSAMERGKPPT